MRLSWCNCKEQAEFAQKSAARANELNCELTEAHNEIIMLQRKLADLQLEESKAEFAFDFNAVNAFSIERNISDGKPVTIIGYLLPTEQIKDGTITNGDNVREWYMYCSLEQHTRLVEAFEQAKSKRVVK